MVTRAPTGAAAGTSAVGLGGWSRVRIVVLVAVPSMVVTLTLPVTAPSGTRSWISEAVAVGTEGAGIVKAPTFTRGTPVAATRFVPVTLTIVSLPATTVVGASKSIRGWTLKALGVATVPAALVTLTGPVARRPAPRPSATSPSPPWASRSRAR